MSRQYNFWSVPNKASEIKRKHRWILSVQTSAEGTDIPAYVIQTVSRPTVTINEATVNYINHTFKYPGRPTWSDVSFTLVDPIDLQASARVAGLIQACGYVIPSTHFEDSGGFGTSHGRTISKHRSTALLQNMRISMIDGENNEVEAWRLYHPWISEFKPSDLDYGSVDAATIDITVKYDWAALETRRVTLRDDGTRLADPVRTVWNPLENNENL